MAEFFCEPKKLIMKSITDSMTLCRLCGKENENVFNIYQYPDLLKDLVFYLPLDVSFNHILTPSSASFLSKPNCSGIDVLFFKFTYFFYLFSDQNVKSFSKRIMSDLPWWLLQFQSIFHKIEWRTVYPDWITVRSWNFGENNELSGGSQNTFPVKIPLYAKSCAIQSFH